MTAKHYFDVEYEHLRNAIVTMGIEVEQHLFKAIDAHLQYNEALADTVVSYDHVIDKMEMEVDDLCVKLFAKLQPMAFDLRFLASVIKINNDFERIGDQAVSIARHSLYLIPRPRLSVDLTPMTMLAKEMVHHVIDALVNNNIYFAQDVLVMEENMDRFLMEYMGSIEAIMKQDPKNVRRGINLLFITRCLERIGDLTTNVAEDIVFYMNAKDIRHSHPEGEEKPGSAG
ncbi:MAG: phosphate transport system regulatory protein PhoU [Candidatus Raymondbacteria bacterium RifOxyA12_full_50_37]|uniref:Phosphate-specific transport system accessory protein PhoU n=1 Tax=Candidatus Raymondbacteria bacterium RIFOXYD12_FULL_49_13 TaxID=1817890 RepID=A0A1F7F1W3_UNCRA|nr:MAG: phosphate transport system regulatory protein PhoU [Candidatus Raymondbacteria bacterium RifOxyA12_full_50_37]OGJ90067.1 MAG: phosphate transport system regulatory protein PhoU [Candidatus Raymondbacteria bacterium RIFOXYA2_FULL_49_16]OGJ96709.1 MAG: phosphate transport system regulatory protein PhoU [Candidatus Raymondbacteria bacterium RifOxyB12_full_50_8]OGJ96752.1 MAG: phosphate transport system regulatory protein PhoU [Candidatus Raymondbacteria bacterium RIFOXYC2_FULL_50_21]OGK005